MLFGMRNLVAQAILYISNHIVCHIPFHAVRLWYYRRVMRFEIGPRSTVWLDCRFDCPRSFSLGTGSVINERCRLDSRGGLIIGNSVSISSDVIILTADHDPDSEVFEGRTRPVQIGDYAWVGTRSMILPGVTIGKGAVVAAGAVVTKSVPEYTIVAGVPAKPVRKRSANLNYDCSYRRLFH